MREYKYDIWIDPKLGMKERRVKEKIEKVLKDKRGWSKFGYKFTLRDNMIDFMIMIVRNDEIKRICNFDGLSCADTSEMKIYLNYENWKKGVKRSKLSLEDYRTYMICHEVGHILGKGHLMTDICKNGEKCPVMVQQTKGIGKCKANCWPLHYED